MPIAKRHPQNPLIAPENVRPSQPNFRVDGVFNCGVARYKDEILLLCRVAESVQTTDGSVAVPVVIERDGQDRIEVVRFVKEEHPELDFSDSRNIRLKRTDGSVGKTLYLTSLSHIRIARSKDGVNFTIEDAPFLFPTAKEESFGMEDPRVTKIDGRYYINYTSVTENGPATSLVSTEDFEHYTRHGIIFAPENKDVTIFPEKIGGQYMAFNRPVPCGLGNPDMWLAKSPDLVHWGQQQHFCGITHGDRWDNGRIGGGAVPFLTQQGWVKIYHAADRLNRYCLGAFLLDRNDPSVVLARTAVPILEPESDYEVNGFFGNVVFTCGCLLEGDWVIIYYGAADDKVCRADIKLSDLLKSLGC